MSTHLTEIIEANNVFLKSLAFYLAKNKNDADDLYQETVIKMLSNQNSYTPNTNFKAWARTIMRNTFINAHRGMRKATFCVDASDMQSGLYDNRLAHNDGETNIQYENLMKVINGLDERKRKIFMSYSKGYSYDEMAKIFNLNIQNLRGIVFSARQELQQKLTLLQVRSAN